MSDENESYEIYHIHKNYQERVTNDIEVLKLGNQGSQKYIDNIEKESDERNRMDMIDDKEYDENIIKEKAKNMIQNQKNQKLVKEIRQKTRNNLKLFISNKTERMMISLILILSWRQMW